MSDEITIQVDEEALLFEGEVGDIFQSDEDRLNCATYLKREIEEVESNAGRQDRMILTEKIRKHRIAKTDSATKDFPWENAANIRPPLAMEKTNTVATKLTKMFSSRKPLFTFSTDDPAYKKNASAVTTHVQKLVENPNMIDLYRKNWDILYSLTSEGTGFMKVPFVVERMKFKRKSENGEEDVDRIIKSCPDVHRIDFQDFMTRSEWDDIDTAPWVATRYYLHMHELNQLAQQGYYQDVETVYSKYVSLDAEKLESLKNMGIEESNQSDLQNRVFKIYEVNVFWDTDGDGVEEDIIVHLEPETSTILRAEYNELGVRDYVRIPYINIPGILYGLGVGEIVAPLQEEADALHNMRIDGQQLAMLPFVVTSVSSSFGNSMGITPGKVLKAQDPQNDIQIHQFPDISGSAFQAEMLTKEYADKASGASDVLGGFDAGGSNRIGAQGTQFLASQAQSFLDSIGQQISASYSKIGMLILYQLVRNSDFVDYSMLDEADAILCKEVYSMNVEDIPTKFKFNVDVTSLENTESSRRETAAQLWELYMSYGDKMAAISGQMANPQIMQQAPRVGEILTSYMVGLTKLMEAMLKNFDEGSVSDYLPFIGDLVEQLREADLGREQQLQGERAGAVKQESGAEPVGGMDAAGAGGSPGGPEAGNAGGVQSVPQPGGGPAPSGGPAVGAV